MSVNNAGTSFWIGLVFLVGILNSLISQTSSFEFDGCMEQRLILFNCCGFQSATAPLMD